MITTGKLLSASPVSNAINEKPTQETRMFKVGNFPAVNVKVNYQLHASK